MNCPRCKRQYWFDFVLNRLTEMRESRIRFKDEPACPHCQGTRCPECGRGTVRGARPGSPCQNCFIKGMVRRHDEAEDLASRSPTPRGLRLVREVMALVETKA